MDPRSLVGSYKRPKALIEASVLKSGVPSLSELPDRLIHKILSLVPIKEAVRTCILSKKWVNFWKYIFILNFNQAFYPNKIVFANFVESVLSCRKPEKLEVFSLWCNVEEDVSRINSWIATAISQKVEILYLYLRMAELYVLPQDLCSCRSLTFLEIDMVSPLRFSSFTHLSNLKTIVLRNLIFLDDNSTQELFAGCPLLEEVNIEKCDWKNLHAITISPPKLRILTIEEPHVYQMDGDLIGCEVVIGGKNLKIFHYSGQLINQYSVHNTMSLHKVCLGFLVWGKREKQIAYRAFNLLVGTSRVQRLALSSECLEVFDYAKELLPMLPIFCNVKNLKLYGTIDFNNEAVLNMLHNFPSLEGLVFAEGITCELHAGIGHWTFSFLSRVKHIEIDDLDGTEEELFLIKYFLEKADLLEMMTIHWSTVANNTEKQKKIEEQVMAFHRATTSSIIM